MSNYYTYREVSVMIAHKLMAMDGWEVYGYSPDQSDSMTDYYHPATWDGIAEKNGYVLCVNIYGARDAQEIREYNSGNLALDPSINEKIKKLEAVTMDRGATESEERTAKEKIELLHKKVDDQTAERNKYIVTGYVPGHMAHPPRCNWHIEKDGMIIAKGNGILKYADVYKYFTYSQYMKSLAEYKKDKKAYAKKHTEDLMERGYYSEKEKAEKSTQDYINDLEEKIKKIAAFEKFINKIDTTCGGLLGEGDGTIYEKVTVTEYKKEMKVVEGAGEVKEGQCFVLKGRFTRGCYKGLVYRIHETEYNGKKYYHAYKLNGKLTKECTGRASQNNEWHTFGDKFSEWIEKDLIAFCEIKEVKTPYTVEKVVKKSTGKQKAATSKPKSDKKELSSDQPETESNIDYEITPSEHTKTKEPIWLVKINSSLSKDDFKELKRKYGTLKGYYSKFTHSFIFKYDPSEILKIAQKEN